mgnify:CR=1 FL=1
MQRTSLLLALVGDRGGTWSTTIVELQSSQFGTVSQPALFGTDSQLVTAFGKMLRRIGDPGEGMMVPFDAPQSLLNGRVREKRRFATQQFEMARLRALAEAADCTLNDVVLALCGGALRRYLQVAAQRLWLPKRRSMDAQVEERGLRDLTEGLAAGVDLEREHLIETRTDPTDRRRSIAHLTAEGGINEEVQKEDDAVGLRCVIATR